MQPSEKPPVANKEVLYTCKIKMLIDKHKKFINNFEKISLCLWLLAGCLSGCAAPSVFTGSGASAPVTRTGFAFDTVVTISLYGMKEDEATPLLDACIEMADDYEGIFSAHDPGAQLWQLNHAQDAEIAPAGPYNAASSVRDDGNPKSVADMVPGERTMKTDPALAFLVEEALSWQKVTGGAFTPTLGRLSLLWNFTGDPPGPVPDEGEIREALAHTDPACVHIAWDPAASAASDAAGNDVSFTDGTAFPRITLEDPYLMLDLGGIAKGYLADRMKEYLCVQGVQSAVINLGGNVLTIGAKPDGTPFQVGIRDPEASGADQGASAPLLILPVSDKSVVTSGTYERYFEQDGVRWHHILDPATGYPAESGLVSVTVLSTDSVSGDALSTACLVLGPQKGQALIESLPDTEALFILADGTRLTTSGFPPP